MRRVCDWRGQADRAPAWQGTGIGGAADPILASTPHSIHAHDFLRRRSLMHPPSTPRRPAWTRLLIPIAVGLLAGCGSSAPSGSTTTAAPSGASAAPADIPALVRQVEPSIVTVLTESGLGSGVVYKTDGTIITDAHVVAGAQQITVAFADGQQVSAKLRAADQLSDVAVLQADRGGLAAATFQKDLPEVGALDVVIGSPLGFEATVTSGIISGLHRQIPGSASEGAPLVDLIQTDAAISPGNSGGAVIDRQGDVVGVSEGYITPNRGG